MSESDADSERGNRCGIHQCNNSDEETERYLVCRKCHFIMKNDCTMEYSLDGFGNFQEPQYCVFCHEEIERTNFAVDLHPSCVYNIWEQ